MKIYTRAGDKGTTSLVGGTKVSKSNLRLDAYGTLDELNCFLGEALLRLRAALGVTHLARLETEIQKVQNDLFTLGSHLACDEDTKRTQLPRLPVSRVAEIEHEIDWMSAQIPPLREFVLPGGSSCSTQLHICRAVCRRAERATVKLSEAADVDSSIVEYLNRLSDYLFVCARFTQHMQGGHDIIWQKPY